MNIRALFQAVKVETATAPYDTIHLKVFYPGRMSGSHQEQDLGTVPADASQAPFRVVIFFNGINCGPEGYQWLAVALARRGNVVVTFSWIAQDIPGMTMLSPGFRMSVPTPNVGGPTLTAAALPALLGAMQGLQEQGVLAGLLDLDHVIIGGHSAGGRLAIMNADPRLFPQVAASFAYAAHSAAFTRLGYAPGTIQPLPDSLPLLLMAGTRDGVIAQSSDRYGVDWETATSPVERTFQEAIAGGRDDSYLLLIEGANHFAITDPQDATTGRSFLDYSPTQPLDRIRELLAEAIGLFIEAQVDRHPEARERLQNMAGHPLVASFERK
jgi:alpha-beta hydrolase superfamily lysophospholipase